MREMTIIALDERLSPAEVMLEFGSKTAIATVDGNWVYRMAGPVSLPHDRAVYGLCASVDRWIISRDLRMLCAWTSGNTKGE